MTRQLPIVLALAVLPYLPSLGGAFVYDDVALVKEDQRVRHRAWLDAIERPYWGDRHGGLYRPVTTLSFVANATLSTAPAGDVSPLPFRLVNLALHAAATALTLALGRRLLRGERAAFLAACVFAVHPIHVEVAANVVGRAESLGLVLAGAAWWLATPAAREGNGGKLAAASILATLGLLAKENALGVALAAPLELLVLGRDSWGKRLRLAAVASTPALLATAVALGARLLALGPATLTPGKLGGIPWFMNPLASAPLPVRLANAPLIFLVYVRHFLLPTSLAPDYAGKFLDLASSWADPRVLLWVAGALVAIAGPSVASRRRAREITFASLWALFALGPVLQALPVGTLLGDRLAYSASCAWALVAGVALDEALSWARGSRRARALVALGLGAFAAIAANDAVAWTDDVTLFQRARARVPGAVQVPLVLASLYIQRERYADAESPLREALAYAPQEGGAYLLLGKVERLTGRPEAARADLERGLALPHQPVDEVGGRIELSNALRALHDYVGAERELARACAEAPDAFNLANLGILRYELKNFAGAADALAHSLALDPRQPRAPELARLLERCRAR